MKRALALLGAWIALVSAAPIVTTTLGPKPVAQDLILGDTLPPKLSDFRFFLPTPSGFRPNAGVTRYTLNTPLFSDYTEKYRYVWMPKGQRATYNADGVFTFPVGTALIRHEGLYLLPPGSVKTGSGGQFKIYTPFWRALAQHMPPAKPRARQTRFQRLINLMRGAAFLI